MKKEYRKPKLTKHAQLRNVTFSQENESYHKEKTVQQGRSLWWNVKDE